MLTTGPYNWELVTSWQAFGKWLGSRVSYLISYITPGWLHCIASLGTCKKWGGRWGTDRRSRPQRLCLVDTPCRGLSSSAARVLGCFLASVLEPLCSATPSPRDKQNPHVKIHLSSSKLLFSSIWSQWLKNLNSITVTNIYTSFTTYKKTIGNIFKHILKFFLWIKLYNSCAIISFYRWKNCLRTSRFFNVIEKRFESRCVWLLTCVVLLTCSGTHYIQDPPGKDSEIPLYLSQSKL